MKRREFLNLSIPATGVMLAASGFISPQALRDINRQFSGPSTFDTYDLIINGAGLAGYFAALEAVRQGKKVLIVDKRTSPGYDLAGKGKLWLGLGNQSEGLDKLPAGLAEVLLPAEEKTELQNAGGSGYGASQFGDEVLLFSGSVRKGMLRNLLTNQVDVLLMTDVCGLLTDRDTVQGVLVACKHGLYSIKGRSFIDASDNLLFSRQLLGDKYQIARAGFVLEVMKADKPQKRAVKVGQGFGLHQDRVQFHPGKRSADQLFMEFEFPVPSQNLDEIEHQAKLLSARLGRDLKKVDPSLTKAQINQFALETSLYLADETLPQTKLKGHYLLPGVSSALTTDAIQKIQASATALVGQLRYTKSTSPQSLLTVGSSIPFSNLKLSGVDEPGLIVPLQQVLFDFEKLVKTKEQCQVLVAGGGTAGAMAALGAAEKGANTIVVDYFNNLGGTKTMGGVMGYYHGVKDNPFFKKHNDEAERVAFEANMNKKIGRKLYHLQSLQEAGGQFKAGSILCGALVEGNRVNGVLICRHGQLELIQSHVTIDATGDGDVAAFAGAEYQIGSTRLGDTQNYSQWDVAAPGKLPSATNRDYDIIDITKVAELQRGLFLSHYEAHHYDFHPFLTVRESRRVEGMHVLDLIDCAEGRHFEDVIALASSDFDPHNIGSSEFTKCGFLLPHSNDITVEVPYRCLVPKRLDGLLLSGRGYSQTHNALQFTRMTADLIVLGYLTGQIAADLAWNKTEPRQYDVSRLQKEWMAQGYLPTPYANKKAGDQRADASEIRRRVDALAQGAPEYLYECSRIPKEKALPVLSEVFEKTSPAAGKLLLAKALAWFGDARGVDLIERELQLLFTEEQSEGYPDGYVDDYDSIRGREKNKLEGHFWRINQNIALLAMAGSTQPNSTIRHIIEHTASGGDYIERTSEYYNGRIDLKFVPFYNRILNLCFYADRVPDPQFIAAFEKVLTDENIKGYRTQDYDQVRWRTYGANLEIALAAALARCGAKTGYTMLADYLNDIHYTLKKFAASELRTLSQADHGYNADAWKKYVAKLPYPRPTQKLVKAVEV
ncbi:FAD-dependent oxidoreductase [Salmonirosea aquatica]|uniref:FAD-dependent oxidoreductase n=1 Tax=Salmonirosea aquatica TaxID=2654236 RepID=A0A7C9BK13_9BACT|nr:FAD-dependent oxidoreductase [Cytophagaceae bacterium SJW1-29]